MVALPYVPLDELMRQVGIQRAQPPRHLVNVPGTSLVGLRGVMPPQLALAQQNARPAAVGASRPAASSPSGAPPRPGGMLEQQLRIAAERGTVQPGGERGTLRAQLEAMPDVTQQQPEQDNQPWWTRLTRKTLGSDVAQAVLRPLDKMQSGGRAVLTGVEELTELIQGREVVDDNGRSWWDKVWHGEGGYGAGEIVGDLFDTGNPTFDKWANRVGGFVGDVISDPLTYLTFGSTAAAGKVARLSMAARAASHGMGDDVVRRLATVGPSTLSAENRALLGIEEAGMRFAGRRVAGTGGLSNAVGRAQGTVRHGITKSRPWQRIANHPAAIDTASRVLRTGQPIDGLTPTQAALIIGHDEQLRMAKRLVESQVNQQARRIFKGKDERARIALTHATEAGEASPLRALFADLRRQAVDAGVDVGDLGGTYVPHVWTPEALEFLGKREASSKFLKDVTDVGGTLKGRRLRGGVVKLGRGAAEQTIDLGDGSISSINAALIKAFPDAGVTRWLDDDSARLVSAYAANIGEAIGAVKAFRFLTDAKADVARPLHDVADEVLDKTATHTANRELRDALRAELRERKTAYRSEAARARDDAVELQNVLSGYLDDELARLGKQGDKLRSVVGDLKRSGRTLASSRKRLGDEVDSLRRDADRELTELRQRLDTIDGQLQAARVRGHSRVTARLTQQRASVSEQIAEAEQRLAAVGQVDEALREGVAVSRELTERAGDPDYVAGMRAALDGQVEADRQAAIEAGLRQIVETGEEAQRAAAEQVAAQAAALGLPEQMPTTAARPQPSRLDVIEAQLREIDPKLADDWVEIEGRSAVQRAMLDAASGQHDQLRRKVGKLKQHVQANTALRADKDAVRETFRQLDRIVAELPDSPELAGAYALHAAYAERVARLDAEALSAKQQRRFLKAAEDGKLTKAFKLQVQEGWERVGETVLPADAPIAVRQEIADQLKRLDDAADSGELWATLGNLTAAWRTWAVSSPGFSTRNALSATVMNAARGVSTADHVAAIKAWRRYIKDPKGYAEHLRVNDPHMYDALQGVVGSGASGSWSPEYLGQSAKGVRVPQALVDNPWTRGLRRGNEHIEGVVRLALGYKTAKEGGGARGALAAIESTHFNYVDISKADRRLKAVLPFHIWMTRVLPLSLQMLAQRPRVLSVIDHAFDNVGTDAPNLPAWMVGAEGFAITEPGEDGSYWGAAPDLPWTGLADQWSPQGIAGSVNPLLTAPLEVLTGRSIYTGRELGDEGDRLTHLIQRTVPDVGRVQRMTGALGGERYSGQHPQRWANWLGVPIYEVTAEQQEREQRRREGEAANRG